MGTTLAHVLSVTMALAMAFSMVLAMPLVITAPQIGASLALYCTPGPLRVCIISSFLTHMAGRHAASISMLVIMLSAPSRHHCAAIAENNTCQQNDRAFIHFYLSFLSSFPIAICCYVITAAGLIRLYTRPVALFPQPHPLTVKSSYTF